MDPSRHISCHHNNQVLFHSLAVEAEPSQSKLSSRSFNDSLLRPQSASGSGDNGFPNYSSIAASSFNRPKQNSNLQKSKHKRLDVSDLLFDRNQTDKSEQNICTINKCNRKFISKESLQIHQRRSHAPPTAHICPQCYASFSSVPNLNKHVSSASCYPSCILKNRTFWIVENDHSKANLFYLILIHLQYFYYCTFGGTHTYWKIQSLTDSYWIYF